jgi:hypothetical protein
MACSGISSSSGVCTYSQSFQRVAPVVHADLFRLYSWSPSCASALSCLMPLPRLRCCKFISRFRVGETTIMQERMSKCPLWHWKFTRSQCAMEKVEVLGAAMDLPVDKLGAGIGGANSAWASLARSSCRTSAQARVSRSSARTALGEVAQGRRS